MKNSKKVYHIINIIVSFYLHFFTILSYIKSNIKVAL